MSYVQDLLSLNQRHYNLALSFFCGTVSPGFLIIFLFKPDLIHALDFFKLLLFSAALTTPALLLHYVFLASLDLRTEAGEKDYSGGGMLACFTSLISMHLAILGAYVLNWTFREFLVGVAISSLMCYASAWRAVRAERRERIKKLLNDDAS